MKRVLIIANLFHASPRVPGISSYLPEFGWESTIITPSLKTDPKKLLAFPNNFKGKIRIIETSYSGDVFSFWRKILIFFGFKKGKSILGQVKAITVVRKQVSFIDRIFRFYVALFAYPDEEKNWKHIALKSAENILSQEKFDLVVSSSSPVTCHIIAKKIKEKYKIPWVADLRDLWTQNHSYSYPFWRKIIEKKLERKTLALADALVTVSLPLAEKLKKFHQKKEVYVVSNGFFPEELNFPPKPLKNKFLITYAGAIYSGKQDPKNIFIALKELISEGIISADDVEVRFYCGALPWLEKEIEDYNLEKIIRIYEKTGRSEINEKQRESQILLLIYWSDKNEKGWQSLKIFGYLASRRPILAIDIPGKDVVCEVIKKTESGSCCMDVSEIKATLKKYYSEYKKNGEVSYDGNMNEIKKHSYRQKAKEFASIMNNLK
jgi:glycosyltransferase involved in cell wall biosynthesis